MDKADLIDEDVSALLLVGLLLTIYAVVPYTLTYSIGTTNRVIFLALGGILVGGGLALRFKRRDKRTIQFEMLQFLFDRHALPGEQGLPPSVVQQHIGARTDFFKKYATDLLRKDFIALTPQRQITLTQRSLRVLKDEDFAKFFEEGSEQ